MWWELGYRILRAGDDPYATPYIEIGRFKVKEEAQITFVHLRIDFPNAEWRMVECFDRRGELV